MSLSVNYFTMEECKILQRDEGLTLYQTTEL